MKNRKKHNSFPTAQLEYNCFTLKLAKTVYNNLLSYGVICVKKPLEELRATIKDFADYIRFN